MNINIFVLLLPSFIEDDVSFITLAIDPRFVGRELLLFVERSASETYLMMRQVSLPGMGVKIIFIYSHLQNKWHNRFFQIFALYGQNMGPLGLCQVE
jgi:hypothetical protein